MSEQVTWEVCLRCGELAAVGWSPVAQIGGARATSRPVEFDCLAGCQVGVDELAEVYGLLGRLAPPGSAGGQGRTSQA